MDRRAAWGLGAGFAIEALFLGPFVVGCGSTSDSATGTSDGGDNDAAPDGHATEDAGGDAGKPSLDAGGDAKPPNFGDAGPSFCSTLAPKPAFCEDFDHGGALADWDAVVVVAPGTASLSAVEFTSGPASALIATSTAAAGAYSSVLLRKTVTLAANVNRARLSFSYYSTSDVAQAGSFGIATLDIGTAHLFTLYLRDPSATPGPALVESVATDTRFALTNATLTTNQWTRIVLDVDVANGKANVTFGANKVLTDAAISHGTSKEPTIRVGSLAEGPVMGTLPATNAYVDDVTLETE